MKTRSTYRVIGGKCYYMYEKKNRGLSLGLKKDLESEKEEMRFFKACIYTALLIFSMLLLSMEIIDMVFSYKNAQIEAEVSEAKEVQLLDIDEYIDQQLQTIEDVEMQKAYSPSPQYIRTTAYLTSTDWEQLIGNDEIAIDNTNLIRCSLPSDYYGNIDFWSFQPFMDYRKITNRSTMAYKVSNSSDAYTDGDGLRRFKVSDDQFSIDGIDDYLVAMGTFYKHDVTGNRFLIITTTGMFTVKTGDTKADQDTDQYNMFTTHKNGVAAIIEWIVDENKLNSSAKHHGNVVEIESFSAIHGEILHVYEIIE